MIKIAYGIERYLYSLWVFEILVQYESNSMVNDIINWWYR